MDVLSEKWCKRHFRIAYEAASWSKDPSSQVGSVIVDLNGRPRSYGFNGLPVGVRDDIPERNERPEKYNWYEHSERNALYLAQRSVEDCVMFTTHLPCPDCARGIIQSGIKYVVVDSSNGFGSSFWERLQEAYRISTTMFHEKGVKYHEVEADVTLVEIDGEKYVIPKMLQNNL